MHISKRLAEHENSMEHRNTVCTLSICTSTLKQIDQEIVLQHYKEVEYWRNVLRRLLKVFSLFQFEDWHFSVMMKY